MSGFIGGIEYGGYFPNGVIPGAYGPLSAIPLATGIGLPAVDQTEKVQPQDPLDRSILWTTASSMAKMPGFDDAPPPNLRTLWQMRQYSTCVFAFAITVGPILAGQRVIEVVDDLGNPDEAQKRKKLAEKYILPVVESLYPASMECLNFGNWVHEIIWDEIDGLVHPTTARSFLPGECTLLMDKYRQFAGFQIGNQYRDNRYAFIAVNEPHIDPIFGYARQLNVRQEWWRALQCNLSADRIQNKASGIQMKIAIPMGKTFLDANGNPIADQTVANSYLNSAKTGECFVVPLTPFTRDEISRNPELAGIEAVKVQEFDWGNPGPAIEAVISRLDRNDKDIVRGWKRPEREGMQGEHGTQADAGAHGQVGVNDSENVAGNILRQFDQQTMNRWLVTNWGPKAINTMRVKQEPMSDPQQAFLQDISKLIVAGKSADELLINVDKRGLADGVELPLLTEEQVAAQKAENDAKAAQIAGQNNAKVDADGNPVEPDANTNAPNGNPKDPTTNGKLKIAASADSVHISRSARNLFMAAGRLEVAKQLPELMRETLISIAGSNGDN